MIEVTLPWPSNKLSPNARLHWSKRYGASQEARLTARLLTSAEMHQRPHWHAAEVTMTFCPPDKRRRDIDNMIASMKAATDGISDALGIDDSRFVLTYKRGEPVSKGAVKVQIEECKQ